MVINNLTSQRTRTNIVSFPLPVLNVIIHRIVIEVVFFMSPAQNVIHYFIYLGFLNFVTKSIYFSVTFILSLGFLYTFALLMPLKCKHQNFVQIIFMF